MHLSCCFLTDGNNAMKLCPCGYLGDASGRCHCTLDQIKRYQSRISGPLLDRIDLHVEVPAVPIEDMRKPGPHGESSADVRQRVIHAHKLQFNRNGYLNVQLAGKQLEKYCELGSSSQQLLEQATRRLNLSARGYHRILKVARTIADLVGESQIQNSHIAEAIQYRCLDRMGQN